MTDTNRPSWAKRLQEERESRGWSKPRMARELQRAAGRPPTEPTTSLTRQILNWEKGRNFPRDWVSYYAMAFGLSERELFSGAAPQPAAPAPVLTGIIPSRPHQQGPVDPELVDYFSNQLAGHYVADRHLGPFRLIPTAVTQYELLCELANAADGPIRPRMWALAAGYSAFIGWLYQDSGDMEQSVRWHDVMIERAHRSLDSQLVAFALHNKAMLHVDMRDGPGAIDLAQAALAQPGLCAKVQVLALQQMAHGASLTGRADARRECDRLLDEADALIGQVDDPYPWGGACQTPGYLEVQRATCYVRLGAAAEAAPLWAGLFAAMPLARRDRGVFLARQAQAFADQREPERAVEAAREVAVIARDTGSVRMRRELTELQRRMAPWAEDRPGRDLVEALRSIGD